MIHLRHNWLALAMAALLAGCGVAQGTTPTLRSAASSGTFGAESIPTPSALKLLEATSPAQLVDNAPGEPGSISDQFGPKPPKEDLGNFGKIEDTLWRGARPTTAGLEKLASMGVKTLVNFENDKQVVATEQAWAKAHGIEFHSIALSVVTPPSISKIDEFLALANDSSKRPMYIHCMQGRDRTGTAAFCYRLSVDHWTYKQAYQEMVDYHFHTYLVGLRGFLIWFAKTQVLPGTVGPVPDAP